MNLRVDQIRLNSDLYEKSSSVELLVVQCNKNSERISEQQLYAYGSFKPSSTEYKTIFPFHIFLGTSNTARWKLELVGIINGLLGNGMIMGLRFVVVFQRCGAPVVISMERQGNQKKIYQLATVEDKALSFYPTFSSSSPHQLLSVA